MADTTMLYDETVMAVASCIDDAWENIIVNYEMIHGPSSIEEDEVSLYVRKAGDGNYRVENFRLSDAAENGFRQISEVLYAKTGSRWGASTLTVEKNGTYNFDFSYKPPKRLNGQYDKDSFDFYNGYLEHYGKESTAQIEAHR